ncbi:archaeal Holliday junction resolvase/Mrr protein-like protein [Helicobacter cetorum MIT 99-5656]|uniref:Archaeal Holliday junction resolvase/Mrr protein-like protein n=1 Tax=Helicobacter cetorum (strain ATCC BAA-540 / CCUG 52418 / MIT 99-5656) TaxID=1163745 RepID=I0ETL4_HELCM|nr:archaeal Holliday junction resolvase/Mrr protein-like protein [Helicobacter cetorum MIT 99-5656]
MLFIISLLSVGIYFAWNFMLEKSLEFGLVTSANDLFFKLLVILGLFVILVLLQGVATSYHKRKIKRILQKIDTMNGFEFEEYSKLFFASKGFEAKVTQKSGDYGADLIIEKDGIKWVAQAKRYSHKVSPKAIQEVVSSKAYYHCEKACVITNSYFTQAAKNLAKANEVLLIDRDEWIRFLSESKG